MVILQKLSSDLLESTWARKRIARLSQLLYPARYSSVSHSGEYSIVCGSDLPIGVDIQLIRPMHSAFASFVGTPHERNMYSPIEIWSIKEACYKVHNDGYEPSDFRLVNDTLVKSKHHTYTVTVVPLLDEYVVAFAIITS